MKENNKRYQVCVSCFTFNHSTYILDTMNGFSMQQTTFPYICCIVDDASTDGEQKIIERYLHDNFDMSDETVVRQEETDDYVLSFAQHKVNRHCFFAVKFLKYNHYQYKKAKFPYIEEWLEDALYVASCEGDDYWISPQKLQKQVNVLDSHPEISLCGTNGLVLWDKGIKPPKYFNDIFESRKVEPKEIVGHWVFPTASLLYRRDVRKNYPNWTKKIQGGDQKLILVALSKGEIYCLGECTCVYRQNYDNKTSASNLSRKSKRGSKRYYESQKLLYEEYNKYTEGRFAELTLPVIKYNERLYSFYDTKEKSIFLAFFRYPVVFTATVFSLLKKRLSQKFVK